MLTLVTELMEEIYGEMVISSEKIYDGNVETTYSKLVLDMDDNNEESIKFDDFEIIRYIHFSILISDDNYDDKRSELDCAILSKLSQNKVTNAKVVNISQQGVSMFKIEFYLSEGTPFWIDPTKWDLFNSYLENNLGYSLFSENPLTYLVKLIKKDTLITKIDNFEIWKIKNESYDEVIYESQELWDYFEKNNVKVINSNLFNHLEYDIFLEILEIYEIRPFEYQKEEILEIDGYFFLYDDPIFTINWIHSALNYICNERKIPKVTLKIEKHYDSEVVNSSYLSALKLSGYLYKYEQPIITYLEGVTFISLQIDSKKVYNQFIRNLTNNFNSPSQHILKTISPNDVVPLFKIIYSNNSFTKLSVYLTHINGNCKLLFTSKLKSSEINTFKNNLTNIINNGLYLSDWGKIYQFITNKNSNDTPIINLATHTSD